MAENEEKLRGIAVQLILKCPYGAEFIEFTGSLVTLLCDRPS
jgi:hypothetical protein